MADTEQLKRAAFAAIDEGAAGLEQYAASVAREPEFGFREFKTAEKVKAQFEKLGIPYRSELALTGVKGELKGSAPGPTIAILGELDAMGCPEHPLADPDTGAAHACGHHIQQAAMLAAAYGLARSGVMKELAGRVVLFAVPAEEYVQIAYRKKLVEAGKIHYIHGKGQLIYEGEFDDINLAMQIHSQKNCPRPTVAIGQSSNGFIGKTVRYVGKTAHAADAPRPGGQRPQRGDPGPHGHQRPAGNLPGGRSHPGPSHNHQRRRPGQQHPRRRADRNLRPGRHHGSHRPDP